MKSFFSGTVGNLTVDTMSFWYIFAIAFCVLLFMYTYFGRNQLKLFERNKGLRISISVAVLLIELGFYIWNIIFGFDSVAETLFSLDLCRITLIMAIILFINENEKLFKITYFFAFGGFLSLAVPDFGGFGPDRFRYYHYYIIHIYFMWVCVYCIFVKGYKIRIMDYLKAMGYLAILAALALTANLIFGYNFMFLMELPFELTWVEALGGFPLYTIVFSIVAMLMSFALYLPWIRSEILERKKQKG